MDKSYYDGARAAMKAIQKRKTDMPPEYYEGWNEGFADVVGMTATEIKRYLKALREGE